MKLQQFAKLISKNVTILSIASAFVLGAVGMTDLKYSMFDTSKWFMKPSDTEQTEFENIAAGSDKSDFEFAKPTTAPDAEITEADDGTSASDVQTGESSSVDSPSDPSYESAEVTTPTVTIDLSGMTLPEMTIPTEATSETSEETKETASETTEKEETTKKTKKTKKTEDTTKAPDDGSTTSAPADTSSEPKETTSAPKETTSAPKETTAAPQETTKKAVLGDTSGSYNEDMAKEVLGLVNQERAANGLAPLSWNSSLAKGAKTRATEIVVKWAHTRPDGSNYYDAPNCEDTYGENLAKGYGSAESAMKGWMDSPGHRANILKSEYTTVGVACYLCNGTYYWVQEFGC